MSNRRKQSKTQNLPHRQNTPEQGSRQRTAAQRGDEMILHERTYVGPLPEPTDLKAYDLVVPGAAERILTQFEEQGRHRRELERSVVGGSERRGNVGQWLAFVLLLAGIAGGCVVAAVGEAKAGGVIAAAAFACGALTYLIGGRVKREND